TSEMDLITRRIIQEMTGDYKHVNLTAFSNPDTPEYQDMISRICKQLNFTSLRYHRLDDMIDSVGLDRSKLCTYCWDGKE
ncbi:MAG: amidophosphoribosyltransferase, partial [Anaerostipes sp.]|nr:amidophosphoribosyltransferase [Anaerostipes sp.]